MTCKTDMSLKRSSRVLSYFGHFLWSFIRWKACMVGIWSGRERGNKSARERDRRARKRERRPLCTRPRALINPVSLPLQAPPSLRTQTYFRSSFLSEDRRCVCVRRLSAPHTPFKIDTSLKYRYSPCDFWVIFFDTLLTEKRTSITTLTFQFHILRPTDNSCNLGSIYFYKRNLQV